MGNSISSSINLVLDEKSSHLKDIPDSSVVDRKVLVHRPEDDKVPEDDDQQVGVVGLCILLYIL